jgi:TRAP-type C4-dicarboxylate transport system substrate-binding protein
VLVAVVALMASACSSNGSKSGGDAGKVVLTLADGYENPAFTPAVTDFIQRLERLSGGQVSVKDVQGWGDLQPNFEQQIVQDVAAGKADLGWVGTRTFDTLGVNSFQALTAPMLIDSYPLEDAVITSSIPSKMMEGLDPLHVTGLAVLADGLRKPIAQGAPLLSASDWKGQTFDVFRSKGQMAAVAATGATPTDSFGGAPYTAAERNLLPYIDNYVADFPYVTANVNLWPQTLALIANPATLSRLTSEQQAWVQQAAQDAATHSTALVDLDQDLVAESCARGGRFAEASDTDLASLRQAFEPVYADLEQDAQTKAFIDQIQAMKTAIPTATGLQIPAECDAASAVPAANDPLQGTWETQTLTESDIVHAFVAAGGTEADGHAWFAQLGGGATSSVVIQLVFTNGALNEYDSADGGAFVHGDSRSYTIDGDTVTLVADDCVETYSMHVEGDTLTSTPISQCSGHDRPYAASLYGTFPFTRVQDLSEELQGTWETAPLTESDIVHAFVAAGGSEAGGHAFFGATESVVFRLQIGDGALDQFESADGGAFVHGDSNSWVVDGDTMTMTQPGCTGTYSVSLSDDTLRLSIAAPYAGEPLCVESAPMGTTVYASFPFTRVSE